MQGRIRLGILALPVSGILATISTLLPGVFTNPAVDPQGFAQTAGTNALGNMIGIVSLVILLIGLQVLYLFLADTSSDKLAFTGWMAALVGVGLFLPLAGILAFEAPIAGNLYLSGDQSAVMVLAKSISLTKPSSLRVRQRSRYAGFNRLSPVWAGYLAVGQYLQSVWSNLCTVDYSLLSLSTILQLHSRISRRIAASC